MARTMRLHLVAATWMFVNAVASIGCSRGVGVEPADDAVVMPRPSDGGVERDELVGHWSATFEGSCYERQLWLSFGVDGEFTLTRVQHDTCGTDPSGWGSYQGWYQNHPELMLEYAYALEDGGSYHRLTTAAVIPIGEDRALSFMSYVPDSDRTRWERSSESERNAVAVNQYTWGEESVELSFDVPIRRVASREDCFMTVTLATAYSFEPSPEAVDTATEVFELPCTYGPADDDAIHVTVVGHEDGFDSDAWSDYFEEQGVWDRRGAGIGDWFYDMFRPVLHLFEGEQPVLYHAPDSDLYIEVDEPPPVSSP
jgi:hypothetical protein